MRLDLSHLPAATREQAFQDVVGRIQLVQTAYREADVRRVTCDYPCSCHASRNRCYKSA